MVKNGVADESATEGSDMTYTPQRDDSPARPPVRKKRRGRKVLAVLVVLLLVLIGFIVYVDMTLRRENALPSGGERPAAGSGTNWLLVGSDSRAGLDSERRAELGTGEAAGRRTDTIMVVHIPEGSAKPTMVSLPRDSYVPIPGRGRGKLNSAFAHGGPELLTRTVESATGLRMHHYAEVGLGGFANITDAVGGVDMCLDEPMRDPKADIDLSAGCQTLDGPQALGYVRSRASARGDLDRVQHQREFLAALSDKVSSPGTLLNPLKSVPLILNTSQAFSVDRGDHVWHLASLGFAMKGIASGDGVTTTVPFGGFDQTSGGSSVVRWDSDKASTLFEALAEDKPVPENVITKPASGG